MSQTLYILGNGFDQYHGLPTSYKCFLCYMLKQHPKETTRLGFIFDRKNPNKLWSDFEKELETFDSLELVKNNIDKWIITKRPDEFANMFDNVHVELKSFFQEWVVQTPMGLDNGKRISLDKNALFLNFNYTNTLEEYYSISPSYICHIHMDTLLEESHAPIVGHSRKNNCTEKDKSKICKFIRDYNKYPQWANTIECFTEEVLFELYKLWDGLAKEPKYLQIDSNEIYTIIQHDNFFKRCHNLSDIYVMGHSMNVVDQDYFRKIYQQSPQAIWHISKYNQTDEELIHKLAILVGVEEKLLVADTFSMDSLLV